MTKLDTRRILTKGKLFEKLAHVPDDVPILFNVEFQDGENWDSWYGFVVDMSYMCPVNEECTHTEPTMAWEIVIGVKFGDSLGIMEPTPEGYEITGK
jgi:hypothetical protein